MIKELDESSTPEEMAQAARSQRQARTAGIAVGLLIGFVAFLLMGDTSFGESPFAIVVFVLLAAGGYWVTNEILTRVLPPH